MAESNGINPLRITTECRVIIDTWPAQQSPSTTSFAEDLTGGLGQLDVSKNVITVNTSKDVNSNGNFNVTLFPKTLYLGIRPGDWLTVYLSVNGAEEAVLWGPITSISRQRTGSGGSNVAERITLTGRDFTHVPKTVETFYDPLVAGYKEQPSFMQQLVQNGGSLAGMRPREMITSLLQSFLAAADGQFLVPTGGGYISSLGVMLDYRSKMQDTDGALVISNFISNHGSVWNACEAYAERLLHFFYLDLIRVGTGTPGVGPNKDWMPAVFFGVLPYDAATYNALPVSTLVSNQDVRSEEISLSGDDVRNWFRVHPDTTDAARDALGIVGGPVVNKRSINKHGIRRLESNLMYPVKVKVDADGVASQQTGSILARTQEVANQIALWYNRNEILLSGSFSCRLMPEIRAGTALAYTDPYSGDEFKFYVESVAHNWTFDPPQSGTTLHCTRGVRTSVQNWSAVEQAQDANLQNVGLASGGPVISIAPTPGNVA
jgi:hypothetical protein